MKTLSLAALALALALPASAGPKPNRPKPKERSLGETISFVIKNGRDVVMNPKVAATLGYTDTVRTHTLRYRPAVCPDQRDHMVSVIYDVADGKKSATAVVWFITQITEKDSVRMLDGYVMRMDPKGNLISLAHGAGEAGKVSQTPMDLDSEETKKIFAAETQFYSKTAPHLKFEL